MKSLNKHTTPSYYKDTKIFSTNKFFFYFTLWQIISTILLYFFRGIIYKKTQIVFSQSVFQFSFTLISIWLPCIIYTLNHRDTKLKYTLRLNKVSVKNIGFSLLLYIFILPLFYVALKIGYNLFTNFYIICLDTINDMSFFSQIVQFVIMAGIGEELIFRGIFLSGYREHSSILKIILMNGLLFGLFHGNPYQFFYTFLLGCLFSFICIYTNSIIPSILLHMLHNFLCTIGFSPMNFIMNISSSPTIIFICLLIICTICFVTLSKHFMAFNEENRKKNSEGIKTSHCYKFNVYIPIILSIVFYLIKVTLMYYVI